MSSPREQRPKEFDRSPPPPSVTSMTSGQSDHVVSDGHLTMSIRGITLSSMHLDASSRRRDSRHSLPLLAVGRGAQCMLPLVSCSRPSLVGGLRRTSLDGPRRSWLHSCDKMKLQLPRIDEEHAVAEQQGTSVRQNDFRNEPAHVTANDHAMARLLTTVAMTTVAMTPVAMTPVPAASGSSAVHDRMSMDRVQRRLESLRPDQSPRFRGGTLLHLTGSSDSQPDLTQQNGLMTSSSSLPVVNLNRSTEVLPDAGSTSVTTVTSLPVPVWRQSLILTPRAEVDDRSSQERKSQIKRAHCAGRTRITFPVPVNGFSRHPATLSRGRLHGRSLGTSRSYGLHGSLSMRSHMSTSFNLED